MISLRKQREQLQQFSVTEVYLYLAPQKTQCKSPELYYLKKKTADNYFIGEITKS